MIAIFPELSACANAKDIERLVILVRKYFAGDRLYSPKLNMRSLLETAGISVEAQTLTDDAILCVKDCKGSFQVVAFVNEAITDHREQQFLYAHLLGHYLLHVQPHIASGDWNTSGLRELISPVKRYSQEIIREDTLREYEIMEAEADEFAAAIIMPKAMIRKAYSKITEIEKLANFFDVCERVATRRLAQVGEIAEQPPSFGHAEFLLEKQEKTRESKNSANKLTVDKKEKLYSSAEADQIKMPKAFAASSYSSMEKKTQAAAARTTSPDPAPKETESTVATKAAEAGESQNGLPSSQGQGMKRLRALAKQLDKGVKV